MKILHLSDLHLGKRLAEFPLHEEQRDMLEKILGIIDSREIECVIIAGDIYNRSIPGEEAVSMFDEFLYKLSERQVKALIISGNHDSAERIAFGGRIMNGKGIYMSPVYDGKVTPVTLTDQYGSINFFMLPFVKPVNVRRFFPEEEIVTYNDAMKTVVKNMNITTSERNVLITHQFITGSILSQSEEILAGGTENVDAEIFSLFDYVALGHIHRPQNVTPRMRYCGTPLKYSLSEANQDKSFTIVDIDRTGAINISTVPIVPLRDVKEYKGTFEKLTDKSFYEKINTDDYIFITLTDERDIPEAVGKLRKIYPRMAKMYYDNQRTRERSVVSNDNAVIDITPEELFASFYEQQNNHKMSDEQYGYISSLIKEVWSEEIL